MKCKKVFSIFSVILLIFISFAGCSEQRVPSSVDQNSQEYIFDQDYQYYINSASLYPIVRSESGYYFFKNNLLVYFDFQKKAAMVVCDQANCAHDSDKCSAYFNSSEVMPSILCYYNDSLIMDFVERKNGVSTHYAYQVSLDGKTRKKKCKLFQTTGSASYRFCVHRGYVYLTQQLATEEPGKTVDKIYRIPLEGKGDEREELFSYEGYYETNLTNFTIYANHMYFILSTYLDAQGNGYTVEIFDYDLSKKTYEKIDLGVHCYGFCINGRNMVYYDENSLCYNVYDLDQKKTINTLAIPYLGYLSFDSENYYIDTAQSVRLDLADARNIYVVSPEGQILKTIAVDNDDDCRFGYKDFLFFDHYNDNYATDIVYYDKAQNDRDDSDFIVAEQS